jgi:hypothetical protein
VLRIKDAVASMASLVLPTEHPDRERRRLAPSSRPSWQWSDTPSSARRQADLRRLGATASHANADDGARESGGGMLAESSPNTRASRALDSITACAGHGSRRNGVETPPNSRAAKDHCSPSSPLRVRRQHFRSLATLTFISLYEPYKFSPLQIFEFDPRNQTHIQCF